MTNRKPTWQHHGALAKAAKIRAAYIAAPNKCLHCGEAILPTEGQCLTECRKKKFCGHACSAKHSNARRVRNPWKAITHCACGKVISRRAKKCRACANPKLPGCTTKAELFKRRSSWQSARTEIRMASARNFASTNAPMSCCVCGYSKHVEIAHVKAVASFPDDATIAQICAAENLRTLCPNCHWEYDHGLLVLPQQ